MSGDAYRIDSELARGDVFVTSSGREEATGRRVLVRDLLLEGEAGEQILELARAAMAVSHPGIAAVLAVEEAGGARRIVTEAPEGETLEGLLAHGPLAVSRVIPFMLELLAALGAVHAAGLVHGRIGPSTVYVTDGGKVTVSDLGVWDPEAAGSIGAVRWMSPEQVAGEPLEATSDLFSASAVMYRFLSGRDPFEGATVEEAARAVTSDAPDALDAVAGPALAALVARGLEKDRADRPQDAESFARELMIAPLPQPESVSAPATAAPAAVAPAAVPILPKIPLAPAASPVVTPAPFAAQVTSPAPVQLAAGGKGIGALLRGPGKWVAAGLVAIVLLLVAVVTSNSIQASKAADQAARVTSELSTIAYLRNDVLAIRKTAQGAVSSIKKKASQNRSDASAWDAAWRARQDSYQQRVAEVRAHNSAETAAKDSSKVTYYSYDWWGYVVGSYDVYTYTPRYWSMPSKPVPPTPIRADISKEQAQLKKAAGDLKVLRQEAGVRLAAVTDFAPASNSLLGLIASLESEVATDVRLTSGMLRREQKGAVIDQSKANALLSGSDAPSLEALKQQFAEACTRCQRNADEFVEQAPVDCVAKATTITPSAAVGDRRSNVRNLRDNKPETYWAARAGAGQSVQIGFPEAMHPLRVSVFPGTMTGGDKAGWAKTARPKVLEVEFSDGTKQTLTLKDQPSMQTFMLVKIPNATSAKITITDVYKASVPAGDRTTVISELHLVGYR